VVGNSVSTEIVMALILCCVLCVGLNVLGDDYAHALCIRCCQKDANKKKATQTIENDERTANTHKNPTAETQDEKTTRTTMTKRTKTSAQTKQDRKPLIF